MRRSIIDATFGSVRNLTRLSIAALFVWGCAASEGGAPGVVGDGEGGSGDAPGQGGSDNSGGTDQGGTSGTGSATGGSSGASAGTDSGGTDSGGTGGTSGAGTAGTAGTVSGTGGTAGTGTTMPPGVPSISLPYLDDFETSEAADWRTISFGSWSVTDDGGNNVFQLTTTYDDEEPAWAVGGDRNWTDMRVEARVKFVSESSAGDGMVYLGARFSRSESDYNYYWVEYRSEGKLKVRRRTNGSSADIVTTEDEVIAGMGTWHTVAVTLIGADVTLEYDGVVVGTGTDSAPLARGGVAISATDAIVAVDDVSVTEP